jgi:subtilisin family serine protease
MTRPFLVVLAALAAALPGSAAASRHAVVPDDGRTEVVVTLASPPLAFAPGTAPRIASEHRLFRTRLGRELSEARIRWRYRTVVNGFAVVADRADLARLRKLPGVRQVYGSPTYDPALDRSPGEIGAPALWGTNLATTGQGMKIGIIDTGLDQTHEFFDPTGYTMPAGFPKGQTRFTTAKVIVARAFPPRGVTSEEARAPFDSDESSHGTHVAGIAAGNPETKAFDNRVVSGVAPRAYLGNYKALTRTAFGLSPNGNAPELVAAIEAAVKDGMDVINLSIGEPEIEPSRDIVARALDAAAAAGVVPVVAAGNDYDAVGAGSVSSPATSSAAIAVAAVASEGGSRFTHADFSSVGPTPISLRLKPDVSAPGVAILSSLPGGWGSFSGTSMASPHVAGAAALLAQRHPSWSVAQIKSALVQTGRDVSDGRSGFLAPQFQGGGLVTLGRADRPLLFAAPTGLSFGLVTRGSSLTGAVELTDAGGGAGIWQVTAVRPPSSTGQTDLRLPTSVSVPGTLAYELVTPPAARQGDVSGYVVLRKGGDVRRVPFWGRVSVAALAQASPGVALRRVGVHQATTAGQTARVTTYRYPEDPTGLGVTTVLRGPELVYAVDIGRRAANFGVVIMRRTPGTTVEPRVVKGFDENRLTGYAALPVAFNPYLQTFQEPVLAAGALSPAPGRYAIVFDSATPAGAGRFTFRFWVNDVTPPTVRVSDRSVRRGAPLVVAVTDTGAGVYPSSLRVWIDGTETRARFARGVVKIATGSLQPGRHRLRLQISDYQESKNTENVARILPNTRIVSTIFSVGP